MQQTFILITYSPLPQARTISGILLIDIDLKVVAYAYSSKVKVLCFCDDRRREVEISRPN